jgi:hypothetical protein
MVEPEIRPRTRIGATWEGRVPEVIGRAAIDAYSRQDVGLWVDAEAVDLNSRPVVFEEFD